jgi:hypothetical protein
MRRQQLRRDRQSPMLSAIVEESALRNRRIDAQVMRAQAGRLIEMMEDPNVALQVVPAGTGDSPNLGKPITVFRFPENSLSDVVCVEQRDHAVFHSEQKYTVRYSQRFHALAAGASSPDITRRVLLRIRDGI